MFCADLYFAVAYFPLYNIACMAVINKSAQIATVLSKAYTKYTKTDSIYKKILFCNNIDCYTLQKKIKLLK